MRRCFVRCWTSGRLWQKFCEFLGVLAVLQAQTVANTIEESSIVCLIVLEGVGK